MYGVQESSKLNEIDLFLVEAMCTAHRTVYMGLHRHIAKKFGLNFSVVSHYKSNIKVSEEQSFSGEISALIISLTDIKKRRDRSQIIVHFYQN